MKLINVSFEQWLKNHPPDHNDKWFRELYPFHVFENSDFSEQYIGKIQEINWNMVEYHVMISKIETLDTGRFRTTLEVTTFAKSKTKEWRNRTWNTTFQIIYSNDYHFITVFTKKKDPSKDIVYEFMSGQFQTLLENRSIPNSDLLFRTLLLHIAEEGFPRGKHDRSYRILEEGIRKLNKNPGFLVKKIDKFSPIYSIKRDLWVCHSFTEDKAHRRFSDSQAE